MCVDPIKNVKGDKNDVGAFYAYERVIPTSGRGVVIVTRKGDKYILLKQYRHSLRRYQYAFPRGYGEKGLSTKENAIKEVKEELSLCEEEARRLNPVYIGTIAPDSGLTCAVADVYSVNIEHYSVKAGYEGIIDIVEYSEAELKEIIQRNKSKSESLFDDGYTIAALAMYMSYESFT